MSYLAINGVDVSHLVQSMKNGYETLVSEDSGRNAKGDTVLDIINRKVKIYVVFRPMDDKEMSRLLALIQDYVVQVSFRDSKTNKTKTVSCYTGTPEPDYYWILQDQVLYKPLPLNFIQL